MTPLHHASLSLTSVLALLAISGCSVSPGDVFANESGSSHASDRASALEVEPPAPAPGAAPTTVWLAADADDKAFQAAIDAARDHLAKNPTAHYRIELPAGDFHLVKTRSNARGVLDVSNILSRDAGATGSLVIAGRGPAHTRIVTERDAIAIYGHRMHHVHFEKIHFAKDARKVTQGTVVAVQAGALEIDIDEGFPAPESIIDTSWGFGKYVRRYERRASGPRVLDEGKWPVQFAWVSATPVPSNGRRYRFDLVRKNITPYYAKGDFLAIKAKHGGDAYKFFDGSDIAFEDVHWSDEARGAFRNVDGVQIRRCRVLRPAPVVIDGMAHAYAISTPAGGPQIGNPCDRVTTGHVVTDSVIVATGDDGVALFNTESSYVARNRVVDSFGRGIVLYDSPNVPYDTTNELVRSPFLRVDPSVGGQGVKTCPATPAPDGGDATDE